MNHAAEQTARELEAALSRAQTALCLIEEVISKDPDYNCCHWAVCRIMELLDDADADAMPPLLYRKALEDIRCIVKNEHVVGPALEAIDTRAAAALRHDQV